MFNFSSSQIIRNLIEKSAWKPQQYKRCLQSDFENKTATIEEIESDSEIHATNARVQSKSEIKARKALAKVGLKKVSGIERVTIRRSGQPILAISQPDVYMSTNSDTHIVFGEAQSEDFNLQSQLQAAEDVLKEAGEPSAEAVEAAEEEDEEEVDEEGVDAGDIELVVAQANVSRAKAVKALKNNNNDIVNAIMELTM
ncbi:MAG: NAC domain-containing protein [Podila humilis]|nr:MAG: NAC domain-containing protein [Podila humilis]